MSERPTPQRGSSITIKKSKDDDENYYYDSKGYYRKKPVEERPKEPENKLVGRFHKEDDERPIAKKAKKYKMPPQPVTNTERTLEAIWVTIGIWMIGGLIILLLKSEADRYALFWISVIGALFLLMVFIVKRFVLPYEKSDLNE